MAHPGDYVGMTAPELIPVHSVPRPPSRILALERIARCGRDDGAAASCHADAARFRQCGNGACRRAGARVIEWLLLRTPLHLLWAGQTRALLFFVLSGFVLSLPWLTTVQSKRQEKIGERLRGLALGRRAPLRIINPHRTVQSLRMSPCGRTAGQQ